MATRVAHRWTVKGDYNVVLYAPGERADALAGSPTFPDAWVNVWWYPGQDTLYTVHLDETSARAEWANREVVA